MTTGTEGNDNLASNPAVDSEVVNALGGNDVVTTLRPANSLNGGTSITVNGGLGRDTLIINTGEAWGSLSGSGLDGSVTLLLTPLVFYTVSWTSIERLQITGPMYGGDYVTGDSVDIVRIDTGLGGSLDTGGGNDEISLWGDPAQGYRFSVDGGAGHDVIDFTRVTSARADGWVAYGGDGNDSMVGTAFSDRFDGGSGSDLMEFRTGLDQGDGGSGFDSLAADLSLATADISIDLLNGGYSGPEGTSFVNFEYFGGSGFRTGQGDDVVVTGLIERPDIVALGAGDDTVTVMNGFDTVYGGNIDAGAADSGLDTLVIDWTLATNVRVVGIIQTNAAGASGVYSDGFLRQVTFQAIDRFVITTGAANDYIITAGGDDEVRTGDGGDIIVTGDGNDLIDGGLGPDQMNGGGGNDFYFLEDPADFVGEGAGAGTDTVSTDRAAYSLAANVEILIGTLATGQALTGNSLANLITGAEGDDLIDGGAEADRLEGGLGDDVYVVGAGDTVVEAEEAGSDEVRTALAAYTLGANLEKLTGTSGSGQVLTGNALSNILAGGGGGDVLDGGGAADQLAGGLGNDLYLVDAGDSVVEAANAGADEVRTALAAYTLHSNVEKLTGASDGGQALTGNGLANLVAGGAGNDVLDGGAGADQLAGGLGDDVYVVDDQDLVVEAADSGTDEIRASMASVGLAAYANVENLTGTSATGQTLTGSSGSNVVTGGSGNDVLRMDGGGDDTANGGAGNDNIFFIGALTSADVVDGGAGVDTLVVQGPYGSLTLSPNIIQIENVSILAGSNTAFGEPGTNRYDYVLTTNDANFAAGVQARINGAALLEGEDFTFDGSAETDASYVVYGGKGRDTLLGGLGNDIFFYAEERFASGDTVNGGVGYDGMFLRGNYTIDFNAPGYTGLFTNIENLTLTSATDERYARGGGTEFDYSLILSDAIVGAGQELTVSGALLKVNEWMTLDASQETDGRLRLFGGAGADILKGGAGTDYIHGNLGADTLGGGGGADTFRYQNVLESNAPSRDHILDFTPGTDRIELERIDADRNAGGDQAFTWIGSNAFSASAGELRAYQSGDQWIVEGDVNGDGFADLVIALTLQGPTPLGAGDFFL